MKTYVPPPSRPMALLQFNNSSSTPAASLAAPNGEKHVLIRNLLELLVVVMFAWLHQASAQGLTFTNKAYTGGPSCVVAADINGDGTLDLISGYGNANSLTVLTNNGQGGFVVNPLAVRGSFGGDWVVAADINGDGKVDLICVNANAHKMTVLTNAGSGVFGSNATINLPSFPALTRCVTAADVNGDGLVDLVCANDNIQGGSPTLTVFTNNGSGVFGSNATLLVGNRPVFVIAADVNGDGYVDLISAHYETSTLCVWTNNGSGIFGSNATVGTGLGPYCIAAADVNGDGQVDLISANQGSHTLTVLTNSGGGIFGSNATLNVGSHPQSVVAADINGDGKPDLISANTGETTLTVLTNNGSGGFGYNTTLSVGTFPVGGTPNCVVAADMNGDGKLDLVSANSINSGGTVAVLINTSTFPPPTVTPSLTLSSQGTRLQVAWSSAAAGWSLQQSGALMKTNWLPSGYDGYPIANDGTNMSLTLPLPQGNLFFRLLHP